MTSREQWRPTVGYPGYEVSDHGRVRSVDRVIRTVEGVTRHYKGRLLRPAPSNYGHLSAILGRGNTRMVHALVLEAFVGPRPEGMESRHLDGNPRNNKLKNLRWGTRSENIKDAIAHGTYYSKKRKQYYVKMKIDPKRAEICKKASLARQYYAVFGRNDHE